MDASTIMHTDTQNTHKQTDILFPPGLNNAVSSDLVWFRVKDRSGGYTDLTIPTQRHTTFPKRKHKCCRMTLHCYSLEYSYQHCESGNVWQKSCLSYKYLFILSSLQNIPAVFRHLTTD